MSINPIRNNNNFDKAQNNGQISNGVNPNIFRTYDTRGIYPKDINEEIVFQIATAFAHLYPEAKRVVLARDSRLSSPALAKAVAGALIKQGREIIDIGLAPDSLFSFAIFRYSFDGGVMISASHNPKEYNGLIINIGGKELTEEGLEKIKKFVLTRGKEDETKKTISAKKTSFSPEKDYIDYVTKKVTFKKPLKVVFDTGNGSLGLLPEKVFGRLGCKTTTLFAEPDGNFPNHLPDPYLEENLGAIKEEVLKQGADIGLAFDGDGDRAVLIDNRGRRVLEDYCLLLLAKEALKKHKGPVVHDARVSQLFLEEMEKMGVKTHFSVCHHNAVIEKIEDVGAIFGGEVTAHYLFPKDYYLVDDGLFSGLKIAEVVSQHEDFAQYIDSLPRLFVSPEIFVEDPEEKKFSIIKNLKKYLKENGFKFIDIDGARIQFEKGWALARASHTSPLIKLRFEGKTEKDLQEVKKRASKIFAQFGIKIT